MKIWSLVPKDQWIGKGRACALLKSHGACDEVVLNASRGYGTGKGNGCGKGGNKAAKVAKAQGKGKGSTASTVKGEVVAGDGGSTAAVRNRLTSHLC